MGRSSERNVEKESMRDRRVYDGGGKNEKFKMEIGRARFEEPQRKPSCARTKGAALHAKSRSLAAGTESRPSTRDDSFSTGKGKSVYFWNVLGRESH